MDKGHWASLEAVCAKQSESNSWLIVPVECWARCSGKENPADIPSRGMMPLELSVSKLWRNGPDWLKNTINSEPLPEEVPQSSATEMKARQWCIQRAQGAPAPLVQLNNSRAASTENNKNS